MPTVKRLWLLIRKPYKHSYTVTPMSEQRPQSNKYSRIVDSAFLLAIISSACYVVGFLIELGDKRALGLPAHLLPEYSIQSTLVCGGVHLLFAATVVLLFVLMGFLVARSLPQTVRGRIAHRAKAAYASHPKIWKAVGLVILGSSLTIIPLNFGSIRSSYTDEAMSRVISIEPQLPEASNNDNLLYLSTRDGFIILKRSGRKSFLILKKDDVKRIEIAHSE